MVFSTLLRTSWPSLFSPQNLVVLSLLQILMALSLSPQNCVVHLFTPEMRGLDYPSEPRGPLPLWLPCLGLNTSTHLPLQPHFRLLLQSVTSASIPLFFQLYWAAIVSPGRCGPMAWSQSSPSSHAGPVTRGICLPVTSWVEAVSYTHLRAHETI